MNQELSLVSNLLFSVSQLLVAIQATTRVFISYPKRHENIRVTWNSPKTTIVEVPAMILVHAMWSTKAKGYTLLYWLLLFPRAWIFLCLWSKATSVADTQGHILWNSCGCGMEGSTRCFELVGRGVLGASRKSRECGGPPAGACSSAPWVAGHPACCLVCSWKKAVGWKDLVSSLDHGLRHTWLKYTDD